MKWEKKGLIFKVENTNPYLVSHAANPLAIHLYDDVFRVFYSGRNKNNKSSVSYVDIDIVKEEIVYSHKEPLVVFGKNKEFHSHGISIGNVYSSLDHKQFILFMAWQIEGDEHWRGDIGRLELINNKELKLNPSSVFLGVDEEDKISLSYPFVLFDNGIYKMWYGSTITWETENGEMLHVIKYATSKDGEIWEKHGIAIPFKLGVAQAFSRPSVIVDENGYHMWFSYRSGTGQTYRIGYAYSKNGIDWENQTTKVGIDVSEKGWDSDMICYPFVIKYKGQQYMFYNGNSNGIDGFGLAVLKQNKQ